MLRFNVYMYLPRCSSEQTLGDFVIFCSFLSCLDVVWPQCLCSEVFCRHLNCSIPLQPHRPNEILPFPCTDNQGILPHCHEDHCTCVARRVGKAHNLDTDDMPLPGSSTISTSTVFKYRSYIALPTLRLKVYMHMPRCSSGQALGDFDKLWKPRLCFYEHCWHCWCVEVLRHCLNCQVFCRDIGHLTFCPFVFLSMTFCHSYMRTIAFSQHRGLVKQISRT